MKPSETMVAVVGGAHLYGINSFWNYRQDTDCSQAEADYIHALVQLCPGVDGYTLKEHRYEHTVYILHLYVSV